MSNTKLELVLISDTHMAEPELPPGDLLVHAGDISFRGRVHEVNKQLDWLARNKHKYKYGIIFTPGNHDLGYEDEPGLFRKMTEDHGIILLNDGETIINGFKIYGSPVTPHFHSWAFNRHRGEDIKLHWDMIPEDTDILITHGPPKSILDGVPEKTHVMIGLDKHHRPIYKQSTRVEHVGCEDLLERIKELKNLKLHVFGHIHEAHGLQIEGNVTFVNASIMDGDYRPVNQPMVLELLLTKKVKKRSNKTAKGRRNKPNSAK